jgi:hypothetical protein
MNGYIIREIIKQQRGNIMRLLVLVLTLSLSFLSACATIPTGDIKIESEADKKVNFSGYKSYGWLAAAGILRDPEGKWEPPGFNADAEIKFLVDRELRKRGLTETGTNPDFLVAYVLGIDMEALKLKENPDTKLTTLENIPKGGLILVLIDPQTARASWVAVATAELNEEMDMETRKARLEYAVTKMIKELPK